MNRGRGQTERKAGRRVEKKGVIRILFVIPYQRGENVVEEVLAERAYKNDIEYERS